MTMRPAGDYPGSEMMECYLLGEELVYEESENMEESEGSCRGTLGIPMGLVAERM